MVTGGEHSAQLEVVTLAVVMDTPAVVLIDSIDDCIVVVVMVTVESSLSVI